MAVVIVFRLYATVGAMTGRRLATYKIKLKRFNLLIFKSKYYFFLKQWLIHRGVDMCGIEQHAWVTTASTNDVPLGARYDFDWTKSSDGKFTYSNCSYNGKTMKSVEDYTTADECGTLCSNTPNCDVFSWWGGNCDMKSNSTQPIIALASGDGICGYVNSDDGTTLDAAGNNQDTQCESSDKVGCNQIVETEVEETITITQGKKGKSRK